MRSCRQVTEILSRDERASLGVAGRLELRFHLFMCKHCRRYARQIRRIGDGVRRLFGLDPLDPQALTELEERILREAYRR